MPVAAKKNKENRTSSEYDKMLEIHWSHSVIQTSATVLCFSNYKESFVNIAMIDLKTRRKNIVKTFKLSNRPTFLFQIDVNNLLVGTEGGKIEQWGIAMGTCKQIYEAHPESSAGISQIELIDSNSQLLRGPQ